MPQVKKVPIRKRKAIMIRPEPELLTIMEKTASKEGVSLNKLALEIIESSGRLGADRAGGTRAELQSALRELELVVKRLRAAM